MLKGQFRKLLLFYAKKLELISHCRYRTTVLLVSIVFHFHCLARHENAYLSFVDFKIVVSGKDLRYTERELKSTQSFLWFITGLQSLKGEDRRAVLPNVVLLCESSMAASWDKKIFDHI